jgi:hypothetical protein
MRALIDLRWTLNRLRAMSPAEVGFRVRRKVQGTVERAGIGLARATPDPVGTCGKPWISELPRGFDSAAYVRAADRILAGSFDVFSLRNVQLGFPPRWNVDPKTRIAAPLLFGKSLNYRAAGLVGDIKYLWEINRHLELVTLAQAWHLTRDARYSDGCRTLLDSWFTQCPYPLGVNWCVSLEHAVRLTNWAFAWFLLGGSDVFAGRSGEKFRRRWLDSIYQHCHFIERHWSRHSSANNHLLGEAAGLFIGANTWPLWSQSAHWRSLAREELTAGALEQTFADGVNKEQAIWYHHAVADMMLIAGLIGRANQRDPGPEYWRKLESMLEFIASLMDVGGHVPAIGDADEGVLVRLAPECGRPGGEPDVFHSLLATGAVLFQRPDFRFKAKYFDDKSRWLLGDEAGVRFRTLAAEPMPRYLPAKRAFREGGYFILGGNLETPQEVRIVADAGPLGYLSIAAHGHADALAFTLSAGGMPILVDPGTFAYHTEPRWRRYFKGTSAHNTVTVDGQDQSLFGGNFLWLEHAAAQVEAFEESKTVQRLIASHDGYRRLPDPVRHRRTWQYEPSHLIVIDELLCAAGHSIDLYWHFAPECSVTQRGNVIVARRDGVTVELTCPAELVAMLISAMEPLPDGQGPLGWFSNGFDVRVPTATAVFAGQIRGTTRLRTDVRISVA